MNFNPSEEEINFVNDALRQFNDIPAEKIKFPPNCRGME